MAWELKLPRLALHAKLPVSLLGRTPTRIRGSSTVQHRYQERQKGAASYYMCDH